MTIPFIDLKSQFTALEPQIRQRIDAVLVHGQYIMGPEVAELEAKLANYVGAQCCITVSSGTEALLISLMALGIGAGDEVITTPFTFAATVEVIVLVGATPVFVDIEPDTCNLNAELIRQKITKRTRAIIPVSLFGQPADMDEINRIATECGGIPVIEDAAQSFGATYKHRRSCNLSTIGCTSFFPSKPLGCYGDGGAIFVNDSALAKIMREIRIHGQSGRYLHTRIGVGGRMDTLQCAIVLAKLENFDREIEARREIGARYTRALARMNVAVTRQKTDRTSVFAQYTLLTDRREELQHHLTRHGITTSIHYPSPVNDQPAYRPFCCGDCTPVSRLAATKVLSLPMSPYLAVQDQLTILNAVESFYAKRCL